MAHLVTPKPRLRVLSPTLNRRSVCPDEMVGCLCRTLRLTRPDPRGPRRGPELQCQDTSRGGHQRDAPRLGGFRRLGCLQQQTSQTSHTAADRKPDRQKWTTARSTAPDYSTYAP